MTNIPVTVIPDELVDDMKKLVGIFVKNVQANRNYGTEWPADKMIRLILVQKDEKYWQDRLGYEHGYLGDKREQEGGDQSE